MVVRQDIDETASYTKIARSRPDWWIEEIFDLKLTPNQRAIALSVAQDTRTTVRACEGSGKTFVAALLVLWFLNVYAPSTVLTTAPTDRQVKEILWREIAVAWGRRRSSDIHGELTSKRLNISDDHFAIGMSTDEAERFSGFHNEHVLEIGDEASGLSDEAYLGLENPLATGFTRLLLIGNPTQTTGKFRDTFGSSIYHPIHISAFDTPNFTTFGLTLEDIKSGEWKEKCKIKDIDLMDGSWRTKMPFQSLVAPPTVAERLEEWGENSFFFQVRVMGNFPEAGENNLFKLSDIEAAVDREVSTEGDMVAGLDIARYGDSETVLIRKTGDKVTGIDSWSHQDILFTCGRVVHIMRSGGRCKIRVDSAGVGQDDAAVLRDDGEDVEEVNVGEKAIDSEHFINLRAELYWRLKKKFEEGTISIPNDRLLVSQLADIRYTYTGKAKLQIESKEEMRLRGSKSPDKADALMLAFRPVGKRGKPKQKQY